MIRGFRLIIFKADDGSTTSLPSCSNPPISRTSGNSSLRCGLLSDISSVFLSNAFSVRSLTRSNDTKAFIRVWKVMQLCFQILGQEKLVTQRELFYKLLCDSPGYFTSQEQVNRTVQDVVALLRCSRQSLGIMASSRGAIIGRLVLQEPGQETIDCAVLGPAGHAITGDLNLLSKLDFASDARYIIIVEKDAIFHRLAEDRLYNQVPSILITAKGYPDIATRYACNVKWLGLRGDDLQHVPEPSLVLMKPRDLQIAKSLMSSEVLQESYRTELAAMVEKGHRVEIEALYYHGYDFLGKYIATKIVQSDYI